MHGIRQSALVVSLSTLRSSLALAQQTPTAVTVDYMSKHPRELDGKHLIVRARLELGWEGDNFLYDQPNAVLPNQPTGPPPRVWIHCDPQYESQVYGAFKP